MKQVLPRIGFAAIGILATATAASPLPRLFVPIAVEPAPALFSSPRPSGITIDTIVLHHTANQSLEETIRWFRNPRSRVSAHFTVGKDGTVVQHVSTDRCAWHAGVSECPGGRPRVNHFSIGIEIVNRGDGRDPYPPAQVKAVQALVVGLSRDYPIKQVTSHQFIARPSGRKSDPRNYPWSSLKGLGVELHYGSPGSLARH